ncbi:GumC family protein [Pontibacter ruber]|uniref:non-specific protein-tyrosine kinase n=1 Tax=Pontibacter ruber TaxID=1343895 RepID=A0ABW5CRT9_9BACT|nr:polysaccharide biosynthesis tyrosine autokinase [Pontibacter ruber]
MTSHENNPFLSLIYKYLPFWPLFALLLTMSFIATWGYLHFFAIPSYEVSASLIIKDEKKGVNDSKMTESIDAFTSNNIVENEIKVLYSRALMKKVVHNLHLYAPVFEEGKFKAISAYTSSPIKIKAKDPDKLKEVSKLYFTIEEDYNTIKVGKNVYPTGKWVNTPYGKLKFTINKKRVNNKLRTSQNTTVLYFSLVEPKKVTNKLLDKINIKAENKNATVVNIKLYDQEPKRGEDILNTLIQMYNEVSVKDRNILATNTLEFVEDRIKLVERELEDLESQVVEYRSNKGAVNLSEQGKLYLENVGNNDQKISQINLQLAVLDKVEKYVISKNKTSGIVPSTLGINDPVLSQLLQKLYNSEIEYQKLKLTTAANNPLLITLTEEIENIRPSILENIRNQRATLQASRSNLISTNNQYRAVLNSIPQQERDLMEISRQQTIKNNAYSFLLQKREETVLSYAPSAGVSRIVDMAESSSIPANPKPKTFYLLATIFSLVLGVCIVTIKEQSNRKVLFRSEIEANVSAPIVAELSLTKKAKGSLFKEPTETPVLEQFRKLRITMGLYGKDNRKKIMVTSSIPGEGKSFVSSNLAYNLACSGKKVVLVDFDVRNPNTSVLFDMYKQEGIIEYLFGEKTPEAIIRNTQFMNLNVIPAGIAIGDHTDLILNGNFKTLFGYLEENYDYIVVDTPPIDLVSDAYVLSEYCDVTLLVMRHAHTPKNLVRDLSQNDVLKSLHNVAIVFNGIKPRGFVSGQFGYGYGYGHASVYRDETYRARSINASTR